MSGEDIYYKGGADYWKAYREGRPKVPDSFFERIIEYHAQNGGEFNVWHDMGAGSAIHTTRLAPKFKKTIVSDSGAANIESAKVYLGEKSDSYKFRVARGEEASDLEPASVDLVLGANMLHYTDIDETLRAVVHQLKPGGTLALAGFGIPLLLDAELRILWAKIAHRHFEVTFKSNPEAAGLFTHSSSPHDGVYFDPQYFRPGALRYKFNQRDGWTWRQLIVPASLDDSIPQLKRFGKEDKIILENNEDWNFNADVKLMRKILETFPLADDPVREKLWSDFEAAIGDRTVPATWPSVLTLVTKK